MSDIDEIQTIPILPLRDIVVFPHMIVPLFVGREKSPKREQPAGQEAAESTECPKIWERWRCHGPAEQS